MSLKETHAPNTDQRMASTSFDGACIDWDVRIKQANSLILIERTMILPVHGLYNVL